MKDTSDKNKRQVMFESTKSYHTPPTGLLEQKHESIKRLDQKSLEVKARMLEEKLRELGFDGDVVESIPGPFVTMHEYMPAPGVRFNKINDLSDDLALALSSREIRIVAPIPGRGVTRIEIPNKELENVQFENIVTSEEFKKLKSKIPLALGKDISGNPVVMNLAKMPHLLMSGATGSGKSSMIHNMILSLLYRSSPEDVRLIMIDPRMLELTIYEELPHLLTPVVTDPKKAIIALKWAVAEMVRRYQLLAEKRLLNIDSYNRKTPKEKGQEHLPNIVIVIDELSDLMIVSGKETEEALSRLGQMSRVVGIHLIMATQRRTDDIITETIKANFTSRICFKVFSRDDSLLILDKPGAELLLGMGDLLFLGSGNKSVKRMHGAFVSEPEIQRVVNFIRNQGEPKYDDSILQPIPEDDKQSICEVEIDEKWENALALVVKRRKASVQLLKQQLRIGHNRAVRIIDQMEREGIVGPTDGTSRPREVFLNKIAFSDSSLVRPQEVTQCPSGIGTEVWEKSLKLGKNIRPAFAQYLQLKLGISNEDAKIITREMLKQNLLGV